jgi:hypothetical protein
LQKKERELKRRQQKDERALANIFQTRALRERKPVSYNYCKELLYSTTLAKREKMKHFFPYISNYLGAHDLQLGCLY